MKKRLTLFSIMFLFSFTFTTACVLDVTMINQDPYPAVPGDYVKLVFQMTGVENPDCNRVSIELVEKYPISFDPGEDSIVEVKGGTYLRDFSSYLAIPYKVRLDENALDGENEIEVRFGVGDLGATSKIKKFNIEVQDTHADFELHIDKYSYLNKELTLEILNIANVDVEALTIEVPKQDNIQISGTNRVVVGDLDSNEYTTADFTAVPMDGEIEVKILYTDQTGTRRELIKSVVFDSYYFSESEESQKQISISYYIFGFVILVLIIWGVVRRRKKKRERKMRRGRARL